MKWHIDMHKAVYTSINIFLNKKWYYLTFSNLRRLGRVELDWSLDKFYFTFYLKRVATSGAELLIQYDYQSQCSFFQSHLTKHPDFQRHVILIHYATKLTNHRFSFKYVQARLNVCEQSRYEMALFCQDHFSENWIVNIHGTIKQYTAKILEGILDKEFWIEKALR